MSEIKNVTDYLRLTVEFGGSDLHLSSGAPPAARVDGVLKPLEDFCLNDEVTKSLILDTLTETQRSELEQNLELDFAIHSVNIYVSRNIPGRSPSAMSASTIAWPTTICEPHATILDELRWPCSLSRYL